MPGQPAPHRTTLTIAIDKSFKKALAVEAKRRECSVSHLCYLILKDGLQENAAMAAMLSDPVMRKSLAAAFANPGALKAMAKAMEMSGSEEVIQQQVLDFMGTIK